MIIALNVTKSLNRGNMLPLVIDARDVSIASAIWVSIF